MDIWTKFYNRLDKITGGYTNPDSFNYATHVSLKNKYVYVETPKVACSSIKLTLQRLELEMQELSFDDFEDVHKRDFSPLLQLSQLQNFEEYFESNEFFKFCFSRNPYTRLLSCYLDKINNSVLSKEKISVLEFMGIDEQYSDYSISFNEFVSIIEKQSFVEMDYHWRPQAYLTCQSSINYDFIGKIESFQGDFKYVGGKISPDFNSYYSKELRHETGASLLLNEYYDKSLYKRVYDIYSIDFDKFSYNPVI